MIMKLTKELMEATNKPINISLTMKELVAVTINKERASSGNRKIISEYLSQHKIKHIPSELPNSAEAVVTLTRIPPAQEVVPTKAMKRTVSINNNIITIEIDLDGYAELRGKTLQEIVGIL